MTPRERYQAVLEGRVPDHLPRLPILMQFAAEYIGSHYDAFASDYRTLVESNIRCAEDFGIDQLNTMSDPYRETQGYGAKIIYPRDGVPYCEKHPLEDDPDLAKLPRPDPLAPGGRMLDRINAIREYKRRTGDHYSIMGWVEGPAAEAGDLRTVSNFFMDLLDDEDYANALMARCVENAIAFARPQIEAGADTIGIGDAVASQVSAATYKNHIHPHEKKLVDALHAMGARVRMHICGNITHILPGLATLGLDVIDIDHMVDLAAARRTLGPQTTLAGNINPVARVMNGTPATIKADIARCYAAAGAPYMVNAGCEIPPATPRANLKALCEPLNP
ncbi:MAG: uroporphyrinogen decarboxylase family protein [Opitutaceae bacterium]|jgi:MtaA/CmuA family methyltransferase|nr:uroporphyrinogen decarboxylase family protein [Opitutaceae bacterium]